MELPFRPNVCLIVVNSDHKVWVGERYGEPGVWQFPQGGVEPDGTEEENALRELEEELGVPRDKVASVRRLQARNEYDFSQVPPYAVGRYRGQSQSFWVVMFAGHDSDIAIDQPHPEFQAWRWCTLSELGTFVEPKRLPGYQRALAELQNSIPLAR